MKTIFFCFLALIISDIIKAQDTIFMKSGTIIPAVIIEKGDVELKYKKSTQPESVAIYSIFITDITKIHYQNGAIIDFTITTQDNTKKSTDGAGTNQTMKFNFGVSANYYNRNKSDNLLLFWRNLNNNNNLEIGGHPRYYAVNMGMEAVMGGSKRNWFGANLQLILTPQDAVSASNFYQGSNEIKLRTFFYNILMYYGHTLNHKKNLMMIIEPGIELGMMSGFIKINNINYNVSGGSKMCAHLATGFDWIISKRFLASFRVGQRFMKIDESHKDNTSSTGYSSFYVNKSINDDLVSVKWSGFYISLGFSYSLYKKMKLGRPE